MVPTTRNLVIIGAFVAVCGLGAYGWMRKNDRPAENVLLNPQTSLTGQLPPYGNQVSGAYTAYTPTGGPGGQYPAQYAGSVNSYGHSPAVQQPVYSNDGYYPSRMRPVYVRQESAQPEPVVQETYVGGRPAPRRVYQETEYYTDAHGRKRGRTKTHSVEIVAGTAAVGAVIGALAGGGKGAAIGAVSGGGAGLVYDRLTHNH